MAYRISYKVVAEQGNALKQTAKDMDNYMTQINKIIKNLGNDELLKGARDNLNAFGKQLESEKTFLDMAGQVLIDVVQAYTDTEKKNVAKVDKTKAHNRDFYKRPVVVASAGGSTASASASTVNSVNTVNNVNKSYTTVNSAAPSGATSTTVNESTTVVYQESNTTNVFVTETSPESVSAPILDAGPSVESVDLVSATAPANSSGAKGAALGVGAALVAGGVIAGAAIYESKNNDEEADADAEKEYSEEFSEDEAEDLANSEATDEI